MEIKGYLKLSEKKKIKNKGGESEDVKPYMQELTNEIYKIELPEEFQKISYLIKTIYNLWVNELKKRGMLYGPANKKIKE